MPGAAHDAVDAVKMVIIAAAVVIIIVISLALVLQYMHVSFLGLNLIQDIVSIPESIFSFISNGITAISNYLMHLLNHL